ncbi:hypothetical protein J7E87_25435 [Streptomyces sp. ISL-1]|uniref:hypothetical protein n=1 Tax=Streptomyces sp. ISL-1 TaxID=2817657 RepID=UPI001BE997F0|nr:hypothetical protein [Streptomyces sp. ISL-1]MBT2392684.1 hypothetical protein [Streptomyces sp. ISL-1]
MSGSFINIAGQLKVVQNNRHTAFVNMQQDGDQLSGFATHAGGSVTSTGITGQVVGESVDFTIMWSNGAKGHYLGRLEKGIATNRMEGILKGTARDENNPQNTANWEVHDRVFRRLVPA